MTTLRTRGHLSARLWASWRGGYAPALLAAVAIPALLFAITAHDSYRRTEAAARDRVERTTEILREHTQRVLETQELIIARIEDKVRGLSDEEIAKPATSALLASIGADFVQTVSLWISTSQGQVIAGSQPWSPSVHTMQTNALWLALRERDERLHISEPFTGRATGLSSIGVGRRRPSEDGRFIGTIHASLSPAYLEEIFAKLAWDDAHQGLLLRADGVVLAEVPSYGRQRSLGADDPVMRAIAATPEGGSIHAVVAGRRQFVSFARVAGYPVYVSFGIDDDAILARWRQGLPGPLLVTLAASIALVLVALFAVRQARTREALAALNREMAERDATEGKLREASRLEAIGRITGGIAHDFNNLLTTVLVSLDLIEARPRLDPEVLGHVRGARNAVETGAHLIASLLAYARGAVLTPERIDVRTLVAGIMPLLRNAAGAAIPITLTIEEEAPDCVADQAQLRAALLNLVINARDAMPGGGAIGLQLATRDLDADALAGNAEATPGGFLEITVSDTGSGIAPEHLPRVFEPFFTTKEFGRGTGLGLSQVFGFVRQSAGHVTLQSELGHGTTIRLFLPAAAPRAAAPAALPGAAAGEGLSPTRRRRILVVDDVPSIVGLVQTILAGTGHEVQTAASADEALALIDAGASFDVVISDVVMPGDHDGFDLAAQLARTAPGTRLILMSGYAPDPARLEQCAARFVSKPFTRQGLLDTVADALAAEAV